MTTDASAPVGRVRMDALSRDGSGFANAKATPQMENGATSAENCEHKPSYNSDGPDIPRCGDKQKQSRHAYMGTMHY